ncbi:MAG: universal stress protein [Gammaproteobacteria bacterium]|nr:universal stress protein [Gammaproteobacteria bacterium]
MPTMKNVLVVLESADEARYVLDKAAMLAEANHARLHAVRVVYEGVAELSSSAVDASFDLKTFILSSEESELEDWLEPARRRLPDLDAVTVWNPRTWEGILHAAEQAGADLIVRAVTTRHGFGDVVRTPDDWNLLRHATVPVMLVKPRPWVKEPVIVCALDPFDDTHEPLNLALLQEAQGLTAVLGGEMMVVVAYPLFEPWVGQLGARPAATKRFGKASKRTSVPGWTTWPAKPASASRRSMPRKAIQPKWSPGWSRTQTPSCWCSAPTPGKELKACCSATPPSGCCTWWGQT